MDLQSCQDRNTKTRASRTNPFEDLDGVVQSVIPTQSILAIGENVGTAEESEDVDAIISRHDDESFSFLGRLSSDPLGRVVEESVGRSVVE